MLIDALIFLLNSIVGLFSISVLLRFYLQLVGAPFRNPVSQAVVTVTNFAVKPLRRFIPGWGGLDMSTLLLAFLSQLLLQIAVLWLKGFPMMVATSEVYLGLLGLVVVAIVRLSIYIFLYAIVIQALLSWVNPYTPAAPVLDSLTRSLLKPSRALIGIHNGIDFSPLVIILILQLLLMLVVSPLEYQLMRLL